jgi:hypothetical protein
MVVLVEVQFSRLLVLGQAAGLLLYQPDCKGIGPGVMAHNQSVLYLGCQASAGGGVIAL